MVGCQRRQHMPRRGDNQRRPGPRSRAEFAPRDAAKRAGPMTRHIASPAAEGKTTAIRPFSNSPAPRKAPELAPALTSVLWRLRSSGSSRRSHDQMAPVITSVSVASGIRMRVKRKSPTQVARMRPAYRPVSSSNAHRAKRYVTKHNSTTAERQGQAGCPVMHAKNAVRGRHHPVDSGDFSRYATPLRRAVTQSPDWSMLRAICAWTASTSSMRCGGLMAPSKEDQAAAAKTMQLRGTLRWSAAAGSAGIARRHFDAPLRIQINRTSSPHRWYP